jgi:putative ABC transport system ATP-binding protein
LLSVRGLRHTYSGRTVLSIGAWDVPQGEASLVMGPSGSGKSTLLAIIAGLLSATAGTVRIGEAEVTALRAAERDRFRARHVGLVPQTLHLINVLTVRENLGLARDLAGLPADPAALDAALAALGIGALSGRKASQLSVGEAQRTAIARAVVNRPSLILADEPTAALDDANCEKAVGLLRAQAQACGATLVVATHDRRLLPHFPRTLAL